MNKQKSLDIEEVIERKILVEFNRKPLEKSKLFGFVLACNDEFSLIHEFDEQVFSLNGYCVFRNDSIKNWKFYDKDEYFLNEIVRIKNIEPQPVPNISIESWAEILRTVNESFPLIAIEREKIDNKVCYIGKIDKLKKKKFYLKKINPSAEWIDSSGYKYEDLTKVSFDGEYENTLILVAENRTKMDEKKS